MKPALLTLLLLPAVAAPALAQDVSEERAEEPTGAAGEDDEEEVPVNVLEGVLEEESGLEGYQPDERLVGGPTDIEVDLNTAFPKADSLFVGRVPVEYFRWKEELHEDYGVKLAFGYQTLLQRATESRGADSAAGGWMQLEAKWEAYDRDGDRQGSLVADLDWRHTLGGSQSPAPWGVVDVGSQWATGDVYFELDPALPAYYWDQWFGKNELNVRVGKMPPQQTLDFFRFKDPRTSFTATPFTLATSAIPAPGFGYGAMAKWWPVKGSSFYALGMVHDMNGGADEYQLSTLWDESDFFYALEFGYFWKRGPFDFDHVHVDLFYADQATTLPAGAPRGSGGGFKVLGEKQLGRWVGFGSYTYNDALGGGLGLTLSRQTVTAGLARQKPLGYRGEAALGLAWADPILDPLDEQYGGELYWKMLVTPDLFVTPGVQAIWNPSLNPAEDFTAIFQVKARLFL